MSTEEPKTLDLMDDDLEEVDGVEIPEELSVLALRGAMLYPYMVLPIHVGRGKSRQLIDDVAVGPRVLAVAAQFDEKVEDPRPADLHGTGTACRILRLMKLPDGTFRVLIQGLRRIRIGEYTNEEPYLTARVTQFGDEGGETVEVSALTTSARELFRRLVGIANALSDDLLVAMDSITDPARLADFIGANLFIPVAQKQRILEAEDVAERLRIVTDLIGHELGVAEIQKEIHGKVKENLGEKNREAILRQQMEAIRNELGEGDSSAREIEELRGKIEAAGMPGEALAAATKELDRLARMHPSAAEYTVSRTYLDWMISVPWTVQTEDQLDIREARRILDEDHHGLEKVKDRILEFLSVLKLKKDLKGSILCLTGPPGVGKTSLGRSIARAMGRKFVRMSLGGVRDEAEIRGHRRTYVGALPGRVIQSLKKAGSRNPVFILDEVDKLGNDYRGDPSSALLEVLDPEQNHSFQDHYLEVEFDLSRVFFIATANVLETIPPPLRDRMEIIELPGYTTEQKVQIARKHLLPRQVENHGLQPDDLSLEDAALDAMVAGWTREAGVRNLERQLATICRKTARKVVEGEPGPFKVTVDDLDDLLGPLIFMPELSERTDTPGVATGLVWTPAGGGIVFLEATKMRGKGGLTLTGSLGDVMKESAQAALSFVRANAEALSIDPEAFDRYDLHVHVPAGATPKDGPSAGVGLATAIASIFTGRPVVSAVAMTGEITLRGKVLPVGGVKDKVLGALRAGIRTVILPEKNEKDLLEIPDEARRELEFRFVRDVMEVLEIALSPEAGR